MAIVDGHIRCCRCGELKPLGEYQPSVVKAGCGACRPCKYDGKRAYETKPQNRKKVAAARRGHRRRNVEQHRATKRAHYRNNPEAYRNYNLGRYGLTTVDYEAMLAAQGGRCACCGTTSNSDGKRLFVDHDHVTGAVRGIICRNCNRGIAALGDSSVGVRRALSYLERAQHRPSSIAAPSMRINLMQGAS